MGSEALSITTTSRGLIVSGFIETYATEVAYVR
jgi:hypothetical protein